MPNEIFNVPGDTYIDHLNEEEYPIDDGTAEVEIHGETNVELEDDAAANKEEEDCAIKKRTRKTTSPVWDEMDRVVLKDGTKKVECRHCHKMLAYYDTGVTSHLKRHLQTCNRQPTNKQRVLSLYKSSGLSITPTFRYDHAKVREAAAEMVLIHEYSFNVMEHVGFNKLCSTISNKYLKISRNMVKQDCFKVYEHEKVKVKKMLDGAKKISITTDLWKSDYHKIHYMVITGHFIDVDCNLHKHVLNFFHLPPPGSRWNIYNALYGCLVEWGIKGKISSVTIDNASANDVAVRKLSDNFNFKGNLSFAGRIFHVRCCAHILNLFVQDGFSEIKNVLNNVRESVKYLPEFEPRMQKFSEIAKQLNLPAKKLVLDVCTRWNTAYAMLAAAIEFKDVFPMYAEQDLSFIWSSSEEEWRQPQIVCGFLEVFSEVTNIISGSEYPTSNLYLAEIWRVKSVLDDNAKSKETFIQQMAVNMKGKFDKYWGDGNLLMSIASALDPRCKMALVRYSFPIRFKGKDVGKHIKNVEEALHEIFDEYAKSYADTLEKSLACFDKDGSSLGVISGVMKGVGSERSIFKQFVRQSNTQLPVKSELDMYLEESVFICDDESESAFNALEWWKANTLKFCILFQMARDILSVPITSMASEAAFSVGGRVIDPYRASLSAKTVEVLLSAGDWVHRRTG